MGGNLEEQKTYFSKILEEKDKYKNIFVFMHYLLFVTPESKYECLKGHIHYDHASQTQDANLWKFIESQVLDSEQLNVFVFAGDLGVPDHGDRLQVPAFYDTYSNITLLAGGMGNPLEHYSVVSVTSEGVRIEMVPFDRQLGKLRKEDFGLERYPFCKVR